MGDADWRWDDEASELCDGCCTNGYDNDGSTGAEIFENGMRLVYGAAKPGMKIFRVRTDEYPGYDYFFLGKDVKEVIEKIKKVRSGKEEKQCQTHIERRQRG